MKKYSFKDHPEHEARLGEWRDKAIKIVLDTSDLTADDEKTLVQSIRNLYKHAGLEEVENVVIVDSPFVAASAAGLAAAVWANRDNGEVNSNTTWDAARAATCSSTLSTTYFATLNATNAATYDVTHAATCDVTWGATCDATDDATRSATYTTTYAAAYDTTNDSTNVITDDETPDQSWIHYDRDTVKKVNKQLGLGSFGLKCVEKAMNMYSGGNFWYASISYLTFFRDVAKLDIDYTKFNDYVTAAELSGFRFMHPKFCIVSKKPLFIKQDDQNRPHCEDGMYIQWRDGTGLYCYHGVRVPGWILTNPELITIKKINKEMNTEVKRVMMLKFGIGRYISESGANILHQDIDALGSERVLYEMEIDDEKVLTVKVINSTPEPDGSVNVYFLSVHPELKRMRRTKGGMVVFGEAQEPTCANAVASTFGLTGEVYTSLLIDES